jgi:shikimate dehydrogenase
MTTAQAAWLPELQAVLANRLDPAALRGKQLTGILGDVPSTYAKSPKLWNAAFRALDVPAVYVPLDIPQGRLADAVQALRGAEGFLGGSVTVPYKQQILPLLDAVDPLAERIGAVNVIARSAQGRLTGYNTDGLGGLRALTHPVLAGATPLGLDLARARVLLLGAGGAAQALAVFLWDAMAEGELLIANRHRPAADALARRLAAMRAGRVSSIGEETLAGCAAGIDLVINATVKGQGGLRTLPDGRWTCLEPYSSLAPASPAALPAAPGREEAFREAWFRRSADDIRRNLDASLAVMSRLPRTAACYDIIYAPLETVFLRQARWSGHPARNGKEMNVIQAVEAFMRHVCPEWLASLGVDPAAAYPRVAQAMAEEWAK